MSIRYLAQSKGVSLIELLLGTLLVVLGALGITLAVSKSMRSGNSNQLRALAAGIASSKIQSIKLLPLENILLTNSGTTTDWFGAGAVTAPGCNCATVNWAKITPIPPHNAAPSANFPFSEVVTLNGVAFTCKVCTNRLEGPAGALQPQCPPPGGPNLPITAFQDQNILARVQVTWTSPQGEPSSTEADTLIGMQL